MTQAAAFDTYRFVKHLIAAGFTKLQAETLADAQANLINNDLATKADIEKLRMATQADIKVAIAELKADLLKWMKGAMIAQGGLVVTLIKLL